MPVSSSITPNSQKPKLSTSKHTFTGLGLAPWRPQAVAALAKVRESASTTDVTVGLAKARGAGDANSPAYAAAATAGTLPAAGHSRTCQSAGIDVDNGRDVGLATAGERATNADSGGLHGRGYGLAHCRPSRRDYSERDGFFTLPDVPEFVGFIDFSVVAGLRAAHPRRLAGDFRCQPPGRFPPFRPILAT